MKQQTISESNWEKEYESKFGNNSGRMTFLTENKCYWNRIFYEEVKEFIRQEKQKSFEEAVRKMEKLIGSDLDTTASWSKFDKEHRTMTLEEVGFEEGFNMSLAELRQKLQSLLKQ